MSKIATVKLPLRYKPDGGTASGGFGDVIFCEDLHLERRVAIKSIQNPLEEGRLRDEIKALLSMRSKHVVQVFDLIKFDSKNIGIVLEYINGEDLFYSDYPQKSTENYLKTLWQIASGINDVHDAGIIHRDIKPNNMKLDGEGILKIFDFGLSRDSINDAATIGFKGTPGFAAPELFSHGAVEFTKAVDVYAFGATALFLSGAKFPDKLKMFPPQLILSGVFPAFLVESYPNLGSLFEKCFALNPQERPRISEIKNEISRHLLKGRHQALTVFNGRDYLINSTNNKVALSVKGIGGFSIYYDDLRFYINNISGEIYMNNIPISSTTELVGSCVVTIGDPPKGKNRSYITLDISYPEVTI